MNPVERLPWHGDLWQTVDRAAELDRMPHAILLAGVTGLGKRRFAALLARALLCTGEMVNLVPCERCHACRLSAAGTHPDWIQLRLSEDSKVIKVDDTREFTRRLFLTASSTRGRVGTIDPADAMQASAANALLKSLEEPPSGSHIIMVADRPALLPPTIRSRCQVLRFSAPETALAQNWLKKNAPKALEELSQARGAPLAAIAKSEGGAAVRREAWIADLDGLCKGSGDVLRIVKGWEGDPPADILDWLGGWLGDLMKLRSGAPAELLLNAVSASVLKNQASRISGEGCLRLAAVQIEARRQLAITQAKPQLVLENLMICWYQEFTRKSPTSKVAASR